MTPELNEDDIAALTALRWDLHRHPEISGQEERTAARIAGLLREIGVDRVETGIGGHGVMGVIEGKSEGPLVMLRAELDALPIPETGKSAHVSVRPGWGHLCGHDGHMVTLLGVGRALSRVRPERGSLALVFQPAEETGAGARAMLEDPRLAALRPAAIFAQHNLPGLPLGQVALREGPIACASCGLTIRLTGRTAHASQPETGVSPRGALAEILVALEGLSAAHPLDHPEFAMATITHCRMGERAFGIAPGEAEVCATLRCLEDRAMARMRERAEALVREIAARHGLEVEMDYADVFDAVVNDPHAVVPLRAALDRSGITHSGRGQPWRPSEDFGQFARLGPLAMIFTGAGSDHPALHDQDYDYPDALIGPVARVFLAAAAEVWAG
ncbi:amidohydrolase [Roseivivax sp.]